MSNQMVNTNRLNKFLLQPIIDSRIFVVYGTTILLSAVTTLELQGLLRRVHSIPCATHLTDAFRALPVAAAILLRGGNAPGAARRRQPPQRPGFEGWAGAPCSDRASLGAQAECGPSAQC